MNGHRTSPGLVAVVIIAFGALAAWLAMGAFREDAPATAPRQWSVLEIDGPNAASEAAPVDIPHDEVAAVDSQPVAAPAAASSGVVRVAVGDAAERTGISARALGAYAAAAERVDSAEGGSCGLHWSRLAAIGSIESGHGTFGGSVLGDDGRPNPAIYGPRLDGGRYMRVDDSDGGQLDGDAEVDRAVGPLQFIPQTWERWGVDGDGDGLADPQDLDDAVLAAADYLCSYGDLSDPETLHRAIFAYNHDEDYVRMVLDRAGSYDRALG